MSKRKRSDIEALERSNPSKSSNNKRQRRDLAVALEDGKKQLYRAFKMARGFERQKLCRRQKTSKEKKEGQDLDRLQAEFSALKELDLTTVTDTFLCRQIVKMEGIAEQPALPEEVRKKAAQPVSREPAFANVTARLYNSRPVTDAIAQIIGIVRRTLGLRSDEVKPKKRVRKADFEANTSTATRKSDGAQIPPQNAVIARSDDGSVASKNDNYADRGLDTDSNELESFAGFSDDEAGDGDGRDAAFNSEDEDRNGANTLSLGFHSIDASDDDEAQLSKFDSRLASSSEDEADGADVKSGDSKLYSRRVDSINLSPTRSASPDSPTISATSSLAPERSSRRTANASETKPNSSFFLPTLGTGYISGSDSDASEVSAVAAPRKNRMGQRARQALWERKHGANANHIKKGGNSQNRDSGWDARRGATDGQQRKPWERGRGRSSKDRISQRKLERPSKTPEQAPDKVPTYGSAHPSWIAKQQAKERAVVSARPAGKKITFD